MIKVLCVTQKFFFCCFAFHGIVVNITNSVIFNLSLIFFLTKKASNVSLGVFKWLLLNFYYIVFK